MFDVLNHTLGSAVAPAGTFTVAYPADRSAGNYTGAHKHKLHALGANYTAPADFTVSFGASDVTVTWGATTTLPAGTSLRLQLDRFGADDRDPEKARLLDTVARVPLMLVNLGAPDTADADGICASQSGTANVDATINGVYAANGVGVLDVPRNVVGAWCRATTWTATRWKSVPLPARRTRDRRRSSA
jgi:hypothetical protein